MDGVTGCTTNSAPPKWMRQHTYERFRRKVTNAEMSVEEHLAGMLARLATRQKRTKVTAKNFWT